MISLDGTREEYPAAATSGVAQGCGKEPMSLADVSRACLRCVLSAAVRRPGMAAAERREVLPACRRKHTSKTRPPPRRPTSPTEQRRGARSRDKPRRSNAPRPEDRTGKRPKGQ